MDKVDLNAGEIKVNEPFGNGESYKLVKLEDPDIIQPAAEFYMMFNINKWKYSYIYRIAKRAQNFYDGVRLLMLGELTDKRKIKRLKRIAKRYYRMSERRFDQMIEEGREV